MNPTATVIVLAAGLGSGSSGARAALDRASDRAGDEGTALSATLRNAIASGLPLLVVTTAELAPLARQQVAARDVVILSPQHGRGVGESIAAGVSARADAAGWVVLPADMPQVRPTTMQQVAQALQTHAVAYAQYLGRRGHPVGFAAELYSELVALTGDDGARRLVVRYPAQAVEVDDPGVLVNLDGLQDAAALRLVQGGTAKVARQPLTR
jgi:molybdenum cofactor cytidylyltransferase